MKKTIFSVVAAACAAAVFAQDPAPAQAPETAPSPEAAPAPARPRRTGPASAQERRQSLAERRQERLQRLNGQNRMSRASGYAGRVAEAKPFGKLSDGRETKIWRLRGTGGLTLDVTDYGGRVVRVYAPDKFGNMADVTIGFNSAEEYEKYGMSMGTLIGRYGNRIKDGKFSLDGKEYQLAINETNPPPRHSNIHGGPKGWDSKLWKVSPFRMGPIVGLDLECESDDGDMGFPGKMRCRVRYTVTPDNKWRIDYEATTDKPTVLNLTHHTYWNLAGEASGNVLGQEIQIFADRFTKTDDKLIPVSHEPVKGTGFDFTELRRIDAQAEWMKAQDWLKCTGNWYDHNFVLRGKTGEMKQAVLMKDPVSGRTMEIWTTEPCIQMYGAQNASEAMPAKTPGRTLCKCCGVALETQHAPDSPNHEPSDDWPTTVLRPGETFRSTTEYRFGVAK